MEENLCSQLLSVHRRLTRGWRLCHILVHLGHQAQQTPAYLRIENKKLVILRETFVCLVVVPSHHSRWLVTFTSGSIWEPPRKYGMYAQLCRF